MSTVNFNDTVPAAPAGVFNIKFQSDASGNISAYNSGGSWQSWTPTYGGVGGMTVTSPDLRLAEYLRLGPRLEFHIYVGLQLGGTPNDTLYLSLPVAVSGNAGTLALCGGRFSAGAAFYTDVFVFIDPANPTSLTVRNASAFTAGSYTFLFQGSYHC